MQEKKQKLKITPNWHFRNVEKVSLKLKITPEQTLHSMDRKLKEKKVVFLILKTNFINIT